jgi:hypothetical protein
MPDPDSTTPPATPTPPLASLAAAERPAVVYAPPPGWPADGAASEGVPGPWPPALRLAFRFVSALVAFTTVPVFPEALLRWVAHAVLGFAQPAVWYPNGAGDKTIAWTALFCAWVAAGVTTLAWTALDRQRTEYERAHGWLRVVVRYTLGAEMLVYGFAKLFKAQFPDVALGRLIEPYGEFSPMSVLWAMMGHSTGYNVFCGAVEALGGFLLFWRRTTPAGALLVVAALANVAALNLAYDVTVKLHSVGLLALALVLLAPDAQRLWRAVVLGRAVGAAPSAAPALAPGAHPERGRIRVGIKGLIVTGLVGSAAYMSWAQWRAQTAPPPPLWGLYDVERFTLDGSERPPLVTDPVRWRRVALDRNGRATVQVMSDSVRRAAYSVNDGARLLTFEGRLAQGAADSGTVAVFSFDAIAPGRLSFDGTIAGRPARLVLRRVDHTRYTLLSRGFHWVQDENFQR